MKVALLAACASLAFVAGVTADVTKLPDFERQKVEHADRVELLRSVSKVPKEVVEACANASKDPAFRLAEAGQPFQVSDVITNETRNLPRRRFIWAARLPEYYVVHYEMGGRGHSFHILLVKFDGTEKAGQVTWSAAAILLKDYDHFLRALRTGKLDDRLDYYH